MSSRFFWHARGGVKRYAPLGAGDYPTRLGSRSEQLRKGESCPHINALIWLRGDVKKDIIVHGCERLKKSARRRLEPAEKLLAEAISQYVVR